MRFGITPREWGDFVDEAIAESQLAESIGFHSTWIEEHHLNRDYLPSPLIAITALSQHLTSMSVGTNVAILPLYHPLRFAEDIATLHQASKGRLIVGVAVGYRRVDFDNFGINLRERGARMDEALEIIRNLWSGEEVNFKGRFYELKNARLQPPLYTAKPPEIWVGGWKRPAIRRAARMGDRWFAGPVADFKTVSQCAEIYRAELSNAKKEFKGFSIMRDICLTESREVALSESRSAVLHMYQDDYGKSGHPLVADAKKSFDEWVSDRFIIGNEDDAIENIQSYRRLGVDYVVLRVSLRGLMQRQIENTIRIFGEKVIPHFED